LSPTDPEARVATSRRRERELARRRFERRRQAELERRARAKRRNTVIGAIAGTAVVIAVLVVVGVVVFSGGGSKAKTSVKPQSSTSASPSPSATPSAPKRCAKISPDPPAKGEPTVPDVKGKAPSKLVEKNITRGHGAPAKSGQTVTVKYVGVACSTGKAFDASYTDGAKKREFSFQLGAGKVIPGWDQGLVGMRAGGVRELVIPASLAYGTTGSGTQIKPNETLIFLVTMVKV
jgi:peptidylprolyl isomerase